MYKTQKIIIIIANTCKHTGHFGDVLNDEFMAKIVFFFSKRERFLPLYTVILSNKVKKKDPIGHLKQ